MLVDMIFKIKATAEIYYCKTLCISLTCNNDKCLQKF